MSVKKFCFTFVNVTKLFFLISYISGSFFFWPDVLFFKSCSTQFTEKWIEWNVQHRCGHFAFSILCNIWLETPLRLNKKFILQPVYLIIINIFCKLYPITLPNTIHEQYIWLLLLFLSLNKPHSFLWWHSRSVGQRVLYLALGSILWQRLICLPLTLTCHVDTTLRHCVNTGENGIFSNNWPKESTLWRVWI